MDNTKSHVSTVVSASTSRSMVISLMLNGFSPKDIEEGTRIPSEFLSFLAEGKILVISTKGEEIVRVFFLGNRAKRKHPASHLDRAKSIRLARRLSALSFRD